ncbi:MULTISPECIES: triose-phosphate isomerase [Silvimonas]|uniref:triose-phosphate isomerase n=1 Tax=Silvimonas TaxID=300264 RepID=UPI0024B391DC|nr:MULTISPECIES: triose-phosphate isomerase [Silvimonas]MDR3428323.1 triose-phosphate isomerase [Silvimonas sp.]
MSEDDLKPLVIGNWKMYVSRETGSSMLAELATAPAMKDVEAVICPAFPFLSEAAAALPASGIRLGAQNCSPESSGAHTGEVSAAMLADFGCKYVLIGHSERRRMYGEGDHEISRKVAQALEYGLTPVLCIGEDADQRRSNQTTKVLQTQLIKAAQLFSATDWPRIAIAYEPIWAIGTATSISVIQLAATIRTLRQLLEEMHTPGQGTIQRIIYGGSVDEKNAASLMIGAEIDGLLIGRASIPTERFLQICLEVSLAARIGAYVGHRATRAAASNGTEG